jgi:phage terminase large subunit
MNNLNIYDERRHNKTEQRYIFNNNSSIDFFSIDDAQKVRGRKRDICYCNEANELVFDDFQQLSLRTNKCMFIDYNPSDSEHFLYDLLKDERSVLIKSTYKDNIYLSKEIIIEIENLINVDENYFKIYALGERPTATARIYTHFKQYVEDIEGDDYCYGLDFGYNHYTALIKTTFIDNKIYCEEILYDNKITIQELTDKVRNLVTSGRPIYCDSARPDIIEELKRKGLRALGADKAVKEGIDEVKSKEIYIHHESQNLWREYKLYMWKTKGDVIYDEPVKLYDDALDALRYSIFTHRKKKFNSGAARIFI